MNRFFALFFLLAVSLPNCLFAQVDDVAQADEIIRIEISSHGEIRYEKIIEIIKLVNTEGADHISFSASEAPGISVSIQSNKPVDQFAALERQGKGTARQGKGTADKEKVPRTRKRYRQGKGTADR